MHGSELYYHNSIPHTTTHHECFIFFLIISTLLRNIHFHERVTMKSGSFPRSVDTDRTMFFVQKSSLYRQQIIINTMLYNTFFIYQATCQLQIWIKTVIINVMDSSLPYSFPVDFTWPVMSWQPENGPQNQSVMSEPFSSEPATNVLFSFQWFAQHYGTTHHSGILFVLGTEPHMILRNGFHIASKSG